MNQSDVVIVAAKRTPLGSLLGSLSSLTAPELGREAHLAVLKSCGLAPSAIDEVISGCVLQAGIGQAPARQAAIYANIPDSAGATTINKMCGSGMKAVMLGTDLIRAGSANVVLASGMESMSQAPYLLSKARSGYRLGHGELKDHMLLDGLEDAYEKSTLMGFFADKTAQHFNFSREEQDEFATRSMMRALEAQEKGWFQKEITPITLSSSKGEHTVDKDEGPQHEKLAKVARLRPVFRPDGTITAANSSSIADGASSLLLTTRGKASAQNLKPLATIVAHASHASQPEWFTTAPIGAINKVLKKANWQKDDVDLFEINEAFAVVTMAAIKELDLDKNKVNIHGGACALGHPIGASGARIIVTLIHALILNQKQRGIAALCIGGGEATAIALEIHHD